MALFGQQCETISCINNSILFLLLFDKSCHIDTNYLIAKYSLGKMQIYYTNSIYMISHSDGAAKLKIVYTQRKINNNIEYANLNAFSEFNLINLKCRNLRWVKHFSLVDIKH